MNLGDRWESLLEGAGHIRGSGIYGIEQEPGTTAAPGRRMCKSCRYARHIEAAVGRWGMIACPSPAQIEGIIPDRAYGKSSGRLSTE